MFRAYRRFSIIAGVLLILSRDLLFFNNQFSSLQIQLPNIRNLLSPPSQVSAIWAKTYHTDDINLPRIQASKNRDVREQEETLQCIEGIKA